jgi:hypothetical protein
MGYLPPAAVLTVPRGMTDRARANLRAALDDYQANGRGRPLILEQGMTLEWHDPLTGRRLPSTLAEYRAQLYGPAGRDWWPACNAGALAAGLGLVASVAAAILT